MTTGAALGFGFYYGIVRQVDTVLCTGGVRCEVPGVFDNGVLTPYWCQPAGWPGSGAPYRGSAYPPALNSTVCLIFEQGDAQAGAIYLPGPPGTINGESVAPTLTAKCPYGRQPDAYVTIWESNVFAIAVSDDETNDPPVCVFRILDKLNGSQIVIDATAGSSGKASVIAIEAETQLQLYSKAMIDLKAPIIQLNGRRVAFGKGEI